MQRWGSGLLVVLCIGLVVGCTEDGSGRSSTSRSSNASSDSSSFSSSSGSAPSGGSDSARNGSSPSSPVAEPGSLAGQQVAVHDVAGLEAALAGAGPGTVISLADGRYERDGGDRWAAAANGTDTKPITLRGGRGAILASDGPKGDYGLHVTGDHWLLDGFSVADATKGIVLDGSLGTVISSVDVGRVGEEGVHFRMCSSNGVLRNSTIHDTGLQKPRFGEGVYVGSANSNWSKYKCNGETDDTEGVLIEGNTFANIPAEGADLKEGTDSGTLRNNTFTATGTSGENSADSAIDAKGNGWQIIGNTVRDPGGADLDAIQVHAVYEGYGLRNTFADNKIEGNWPGYGFGLYPLADNVVACSNTAPGAALGLVGDSSKPATCR